MGPPSTTLSIWMGLMLTMLLVRLIFYCFYKNNIDSQQIKRFSYFLIIGSATSGLIWGIGGILLFPPDHLNYQLFILLSLMAMVVGSTFTLSVYLPAYFAYAPLSLLPIIIHLFLIGDSIHTTLGIVSLVFFVAVTSFNLKMNRSFKGSLQMRYDNLDLIAQLRFQKAEADNANRAKSKFLAAASHDLRQPLYALTLFTSKLDELIQYPEVRKVVQQIKMSVTSMNGLFNALLDISQFDAGIIKPKKLIYYYSQYSKNYQMTSIPRQWRKD
jgi:signal transduction histidine kinase